MKREGGWRGLLGDAEGRKRVATKFLYFIFFTLPMALARPVRRNAGWLLAILFVAEGWWIAQTFEPPKELDRYFYARPTILHGAKGPGNISWILPGWDSIIADLSFKQKWDSLMRLHPELLDTGGVKAENRGGK